MKVLLIKPYSHFPTRIPHLGLGYLGAALQNSGHDVVIADCPREGLNLKRLMTMVQQQQPEMVGLSVFSSDIPHAKKICREIRAVLPRVVLVLGGAHPSCLPEHCFSYIPELDFVFMGEAENGIVQLVRRLQDGSRDFEDVPGLCFTRDDALQKNPLHFEKDLDALGMPAWDLLKPRIQGMAPHGAFVKQMPVAPIITTRGCPFPCTFCAARCISGRAIRFRSLEGIFEEVDFLVKRYGIREIHIEDDNFTFRREYALSFCRELLRRNIDITWCCPNGVRLDTLDSELLHLMKQSGCYSLSLGIESGCDAVLKRIKKGLTTSQIREQVTLIHEAGIKTTGFFIIGFPDETEADILKTIRFAGDLPLDRAQFSTFLPLPGTVFFDDYLKDHSLEDIPWEKFFTTEIVWKSSQISARKMSSYQRKAFLHFYLRPSILWGLFQEVKNFRHLAQLTWRVKEIFK